jgi:type IV secretion system protein VirB1
MMGCQDLAVPAAVMRHVVHVESGANPYAIGVVGRRLVRQPQNLEEAVATARTLEAGGYNFSLGIAQVNRVNFDKYGLDLRDKAFDVCSNLSAASRILADCYASAGGHWGKAFSCYYSGNFVKGFEDGYVQRIYDSIRRGRAIDDGGKLAPAIPLVGQDERAAAAASGSTVTGKATRPTTGPDRIAMRSLPLNGAAEAAGGSDAVPTLAAPSKPAAAITPPAGASTVTPEAFVPQVRGPGDSHTRPTAIPQAAPAATADQADLRKAAQDGAFVF